MFTSLPHDSHKSPALDEFPLLELAGSKFAKQKLMFESALLAYVSNDTNYCGDAVV